MAKFDTDYTKLFPAIYCKRKVLIDLNINGHSVYAVVVTAEYIIPAMNEPIALYNNKGRKLTHLLKSLRNNDLTQYLETVN